MRKEVRTGAAIGGILVVVLSVYIVVNSRSKHNKDVSLETNKTTPAGENAGGADPASPGSETPAQIPAPEPSTDTPPVVAGGAVAGDPHPEPVVPPTPVAEAPSAGAASWAQLLASNEPQRLMSPRSRSADPIREPTVSGSPLPPAVQRIVDRDETPATPGIRTRSTSGSGSGGAAPSETIPGVATSHKVEAGETFSSIAKSVYGDSRFYKEIMKANPNVDPTRMRTGTTIVLPAHSQIKHEPAATLVADRISTDNSHRRTPASLPPVNPKSEYRVESSDTLYKISLKLYHTPNKVDAIYQLNKQVIGSDPGRLKLHTTLKLPEAPVETASR